jgi:hypothetical protein
MSSKPRTSRITQKVADQKLSEGLKKHKTDVVSFAIAGTSPTVDAVLAALDARIAAESAADSARATWQTKVQVARDERSSTRVLVSGVRQALQLKYANEIDTLADFGLKPRKQPAPRTPEQRAEAVAKAKATRAARHTMGSKQKAKIKGAAPAAPATTPPAALKPAQ